MMNRGMRFVSLAVLVLMYLITACSTLPVPHALPPSGVLVEGDKINCDGKPFAELRYYFTSKSKPTLHRGLAIYYYGDNKLVWIYPAKGLEKSIARGRFVPRSKAAARLNWVFDVVISLDGKTISYKTYGSFGDSSNEFLVEEGKSR